MDDYLIYELSTKLPLNWFDILLQIVIEQEY